ncbi:MAG: hypothetical protein RL748_230 [Pseudomonadota bacterium]|jgi:hypothetical protein
MFQSSSKSIITKTLATAALLAATAAPAMADQIRVTMTVDNSYALFYGTQSTATNFVGSNFSWPTARTFNFNLPTNQYLYVVTASDLSVAQGFLGQFENLTQNYKFYSQDSQWQVMATGLGSNAPYSGSAADLALLSHELVDANNGGNASHGWVGTTAGPNNGSAPWGRISGIDSAARWVWYSNNGDIDPTTPGHNHDEWLVFRIPVAATPVPEPETYAMMGLGLAALAFVVRRKKQVA